jgi:hypothetical protein
MRVSHRTQWSFSPSMPGPRGCRPLYSLRLIPQAADTRRARWEPGPSGHWVCGAAGCSEGLFARPERGVDFTGDCRAVARHRPDLVDPAGIAETGQLL